MSSEHYFSKFREALLRLRQLVSTDLEYQETKVHETRSCLAAKRLSSVTGQYINIYNDIRDCLHQNLQVQKTIYIQAIAKAILARIIELKNDLYKLEASKYHFFGHGLVQVMLTTFDVEINEVPTNVKRPEHIQKAIDDILSKVKEKLKITCMEEEVEEEAVEKELHWWDDDYEEATTETSADDHKPVEVVSSEETLHRQQLINVIKSHEKSRQVIQKMIQSRQKRERWTKVLEGEAKPPAPYVLREKAAALIQKVLRAYFELKRNKIQELRRSAVMGMTMTDKPDFEAREKFNKLKQRRPQLMMKFEEDWKAYCDDLTNKVLEQKSDTFAEDYRDFIRGWFKQWYQEIKYFHDIPGDDEGGLALIIKGELPSPHDWLEKYEAELIKMQSNKGKSALQLKFQKQEAKREQLKLKKEALVNKKLEANLLKKMMKNPNMHPGYNYPTSKKTTHILEVIDDYYRNWNHYDIWNISGVKEKHIQTFDYDKACADAKLQVLNTVNADMRNELNILKEALKVDYERNEEKMLTPIKKPTKRTRKKHKLKTTLSEHIIDRMEYLATYGYIKQYTKIGLDEFLGDPNFAGDDLRCLCEPAYAQHGEIRYVWWDICREVTHKFNRILLIGPRGSGKTTLIHILASVNDAVLFELDAGKIAEELITAVFLQELVNLIASCARSVQPSIIHIKQVHRLYYLKVPPEEGEINFELLKKYFVQKLSRKFHRSDKVTIIGSCVDPWLTKSSQMLKKFPKVILVPNTSFSITSQLLKTWVLSHPVIPKDLEVNSLAYVLQGYPYGYLERTLQAFMSPERTIQIAARGLKPTDIYNFVIENESVAKVDYTIYRKWYEDKTSWGRKEKKNLQDRKEFRLLVAQFEEKIKKKGRKPTPTRG